jgi:hypothetical protein
MVCGLFGGLWTSAMDAVAATTPATTPAPIHRRGVGFMSRLRLHRFGSGSTGASVARRIVSPVLELSPIKTIEGFWPNGLPTLWNNLARFQSGSPPLTLQKVGNVDTCEALHAAAKLRVEELYDGFMLGFTGGNQQMDVHPYPASETAVHGLGLLAR